MGEGQSGAKLVLYGQFGSRHVISTFTCGRSVHIQTFPFSKSNSFEDTVVRVEGEFCSASEFKIMYEEGICCCWQRCLETVLVVLLRSKPIVFSNT